MSVPPTTRETEPKPLVTAKKYLGMYVAFASVNDETVIASGTDASVAMKNAQKKGYASPVLFYVPKEDSVNLY